MANVALLHLLNARMIVQNDQMGARESYLTKFSMELAAAILESKALMFYLFQVSWYLGSL